MAQKSDLKPNPHDARFARYSEGFVTFARSHNLLIDKYPHDSPVWSFCFAHPLGGQAKLDLSIDETGAITLHSVWWVDSYARFTRSLRWGQKIAVPPDPEAALAALRDALSMVVAWRSGEWTQVADGYAPIWGRYSEAQFEAMTPRWPDPVRDD